MPGDRRTPDYPLDGATLPLERYEHRRITARDLMVANIMRDFMNPKRVTAETYTRLATKDFSEVGLQDLDLWSDIRALHHMLFTSESSLGAVKGRSLHSLLQEKLFGTKNEQTIKKPHRAGLEPKPVTVGDRILDLVSRHFLEVDDLALRMWISRARPPRIPEGPKGQRTSRNRNPGRGPSRAEAVSDFTALIELQRQRDGKIWTENDTLHLRNFQGRVAVQDKLRLFDGRVIFPEFRQNMQQNTATIKGTQGGLEMRHWAIDILETPFLLLPRWPEGCATTRWILQPSRSETGDSKHPLRENCLLLDLNLNPGRGRDRDGFWTTGQGGQKARGLAKNLDGRWARPRRCCCSEPPPRSFMVAGLPRPDEALGSLRLEMVVPCMKLSRLDHRSRRRSLSRTHVQAMFDWDVVVPQKSCPMQRCRHIENVKCENCNGHHHTSQCVCSCGHCGAPNPRAFACHSFKSKKPSLGGVGIDDGDLEDHPQPGEHQSPHMAPQCRVARHNRCKCVAFPTFHVAARCPVTCSRSCGNPAPPGSFRHRNAMTCRARCCMCGLRGHTGRECRALKCRCGGSHLGQDCAWNPVCHVPGCDRYLCGLHCRECGSTRKPFVGARCRACLGMPDALESTTAAGAEIEARHDAKSDDEARAQQMPDGLEDGKSHEGAHDSTAPTGQLVDDGLDKEKKHGENSFDQDGNPYRPKGLTGHS